MAESNRKANLPRILVVYPFFALYRRPIIEELLKNDEFDFWFAGDVCDRYRTNTPIRTWEPTESGKFIQIFSFVIGKIALMQPGILDPRLHRGVSGYIFLGNYQFLFSWAGLILASLLKRPAFLWTHGWTHYRERRSVRVIKHVFYRLSTALMLYGDRAKAIGLSYGFCENRLFPIYNSLDYAEQKKWRIQRSLKDRIQVRSESFADPDRFTLMFLGRITMKAKIFKLWEALEDFPEPVNVFIVGNGSAIPKRIGHHNICHISETHGEERLSLLFNASDLFVYPGEIGLSAIHSMAYGLPVVTQCSTERGMPESEIIVEGVTGSFYENGNAQSFKKSILEWKLRLQNDAERISKSCIEAVEQRYTPQSQADRIVEILKKHIKVREQAC